MNKRLVMAASVFLVAGVLIASAGMAQRHGGQGMMRGGTAQGAYGPYGMDQEQYQAMQEIGQKYQTKYVELRRELVNKQAELQALMAGSQVAPEKAKSAFEEIQEVQADLFELQLKQRNELRDQGLDFGYGMGAGMMNTPGMGRGMMHGYGGGPGMMPGYGMGQGMMGSPGMGQGWMHNNW